MLPFSFKGFFKGPVREKAHRTQASFLLRDKSFPHGSFEETLFRFFSFLFVSFPREGTLHVSLLRTGHYKQPSRVLFFFPYPFFLKRVSLTGLFFCMLPFSFKGSFPREGTLHVSLLRIGRDTLKICRILFLSLLGFTKKGYQTKDTGCPPFRFF